MGPFFGRAATVSTTALTQNRPDPGRSCKIVPTQVDLIILLTQVDLVIVLTQVDLIRVDPGGGSGTLF